MLVLGVSKALGESAVRVTSDVRIHSSQFLQRVAKKVEVV